MKKPFFLTFVILFFVSLFASGQMYVGMHLNDIKKKYPVGSLLKNENYGYTYGVTLEDEDEYYLFFVNQELKCYLTVLQPLTSTCLQAYIESLNKNWVIVDNYHWKYYRDDGYILFAEFRKVNNVDKPCIGFSFFDTK